MPIALAAPRWVRETDMGFLWKSPENTMGWIDLRSLPQCADKGTQFPLRCFSVLSAPAVGSLKLGDTLDSPIGTALRRTASAELGLGQDALSTAADTPRKMLVEFLALQADPTGQTRWNPLRGDRRGGAYISLAGQKVWSSGFDSVIQANTLAVFQVNYRRHRQVPDSLTGLGRYAWIQSFRTKEERQSRTTLTETQARERWLEVLRRWTGHKMLSIYGQMSDELAEQILPSEYNKAGWESPQTTITEDFSGSSIANFTQVDPGGAGGAIDESGGRLIRGANDGANFPTSARHDTSLSTDAQYAELIQVTQPSNSNRFFGPATRFQSDAETAYYAFVRENGNLVRLDKVVAATRTILFEATNVGSWPQTVRLISTSADAHSIEVDSVEENAGGTDTSIQDNLQVGIVAHNGKADHGLGDDFEAADLAAAGWTGKINGVTNPAKVLGVAAANIAKVNGVA